VRGAVIGDGAQVAAGHELPPGARVMPDERVPKPA
jgi:hypothetical protein